MRTKLIGLLTDDFKLYHALVTKLKEFDRPFVSLSKAEVPHLPRNVGVLITSEKLGREVEFGNKVVCANVKDVDFAIEKAMDILRGARVYRELVVGIDPGEKPGIAVMGDGELLSTFTTRRPGEVADIVSKALSTYAHGRSRIRIGHGDKANRNRIVNCLAVEGLEADVVDEKSTTRRGSADLDDPDIAAAVRIAQTKRLARSRESSPTRGEVRNVQGRSRRLTDGRMTISKELAKLVAGGSITMKSAIRIHSRKGKKQK